jgi:hypothetical protein
MLDSFLGNGSVNAATVTHAKRETWCCLGDPRRGVVKNWGNRVEAGSNTSTVALRVVGGDEEGGL